MKNFLSKIDRFGADWVVPVLFVAFAVLFGHVAYDWLDAHTKVAVLVKRLDGWFGPAGSAAMAAAAAWFAVSHGRCRGRQMAEEVRLAEVAKFAGWQQGIFEELDKIHGRIDVLASLIGPLDVEPVDAEFEDVEHTIVVDVPEFPNAEPIPYQPDGFAPEIPVFDIEPDGVVPMIEQDSDPIRAWDTDEATTVRRRRQTQPLQPLFSRERT